MFVLSYRANHKLVVLWAKVEKYGPLGVHGPLGVLEMVELWLLLTFGLVFKYKSTLELERSTWRFYEFDFGLVP